MRAELLHRPPYRGSVDGGDCSSFPSIALKPGQEDEMLARMAAMRAAPGLGLNDRQSTLCTFGLQIGGFSRGATEVVEASRLGR